MIAAIPTQRRRDARCDTWPRVRLGEVCVSLTSQIRQRDLDGNTGPYPIFGAAGFLRNSCFCMVGKPAIAMVKDGAGVGRVMCIPANSAVIGTMLILKPNNGIDRGYLFYALSSLNLGRLCSGATIPHLYFRDMKALTVPLPPLAIQRRIAAKLDRLCDIVAKRKNQLLQLNQLVKSRFVEMFGDVTVNDREWETATLPELGELNRGVSKARPRNSPELLGGPYPLVQTGDVSNSGLWIKNYSSTYSDKGLAQSRLWKRGTLCITIAANIAQTAILDFDACFPDSVVGFVPNERTDAIFIHYWFSFFQKILEAQAPQVAQKNINLRILSGLKVVEPPLALQREFAAFVAKVDKLAFAVRESLESAEKLYRQQLSEAFA